MTNDDRFSGRVAFVTGAPAGSGLRPHGVYSRRVRGSPPSTCSRPGSRAPSSSWATSPARTDVGAAVARTSDELGPVDVLVCSAGIPGASLHTAEVRDEEWKRVFAINADGVFWCNRAVAPGMAERGYGRIVNVSSIAGKEGNPMAAAYSASKAAVIGLTKAVGKDFAGTGVTINCIAPAVIQTPILEGLSPEHVDYMIERIPMGRMGTVDEVASLICWLASEEASFSTGATYDISGGRAVY